jgi:hypothetical protein
MASDRARVSYDPTRHYQSVVMQQGRVTLEADVNEAEVLASELLREETLDIVGPAGTPDNGYQVGGNTATNQPFDFHVGPGTMYVGGERVSLGEPGIDYSNQPEWLDHDGDPLFVNAAAGAGVFGGNELIELFLREQEVSAVEDTTLREVALGGPDTAQRSRLIQRILRLPVKGTTCPDAEAEVDKRWPALGVSFDPATMRLKSPATLQVQFVQQAPPANPCDPAVPGGYLGADNQLIRVQITSYDDKKNTGTFVWGYNNASFLYRVTAVDSQTLELSSTPIDTYHTPRPGEAVEVLRTAISLGNKDYVAEHTGQVQTPTQAFVPETRRLSLPNALPAEYTDPKKTPQLFLRLWEAEVPFTPGKPADLAGSGLQVVIQPGGPTGLLTIGQYWMFAVRPSTPQQLYPKRYLDAPQPPEGPRMWVCPLAVIDWTLATLPQFNLLEDCRQFFDNLVELTKRGKCCSITVTPDDVTHRGGLQAIIDSNNNVLVTISLRPGAYQLKAPLVIGPGSQGLILEGCQDGVILQAAGPDPAFLAGMVILDQATDVTLRRLTFVLPLVSFEKAQAKLAGLDPAQLSTIGGPEIARLEAGIGVRAISCKQLTVEGCTFQFQQPPSMNVFEAGIFLNGDCTDIEVSDSRFIHSQAAAGATGLFSSRTGILMTPLTAVRGLAENADTTKTLAIAGLVLPASLSNCTIEGNTFSGLDCGALVYADMTSIRVDDNTAEDCYAGFWFLSLRTLAFTDDVFKSNKAVGDRYAAALVDPVLALGGVIGRGYPVPAGLSAVAKLFKRVNKANWTAPKTVSTTDAALKRGFILHTFISPVEQSVFGKIQRTLPLAMMITENQIDALEVLPPPNSGTPVPTGTRLLVWNDDSDLFGALIISANEIRNQVPTPQLPTVGVVLVARCTVTGNLILNEQQDERKTSLSIIPVDPKTNSSAGIAVTGNVFRGKPDLPPRAVPAPLNDWLVLNTVVP